MTYELTKLANIEKIAEDNPDLPLKFIRDILLGIEEAKEANLSEYIFGENDNN